MSIYRSMWRRIQCTDVRIASVSGFISSRGQIHLTVGPIVHFILVFSLWNSCCIRTPKLAWSPPISLRSMNSIRSTLKPNTDAYAWASLSYIISIVALFYYFASKNLFADRFNDPHASLSSIVLVLIKCNFWWLPIRRQVEIGLIDIESVFADQREAVPMWIVHGQELPVCLDLGVLLIKLLSPLL